MKLPDASKYKSDYLIFVLSIIIMLVSSYLLRVSNDASHLYVWFNIKVNSLQWYFGLLFVIDILIQQLVFYSLYKWIHKKNNKYSVTITWIIIMIIHLGTYMFLNFKWGTFYLISTAIGGYLFLKLYQKRNNFLIAYAIHLLFYLLLNYDFVLNLLHLNSSK